MTYKRRPYGEIVESVLRELSQGTVDRRFIYSRESTACRIDGRQGKVTAVEGIVKGKPASFRRGIDYEQDGDNLEWLDGDRPDDGTPFYVFQAAESTAGFTDVAPGSVIRTLVGAIALEIDYYYAQLDSVYAAGFVDTAAGESLDRVVALLGVERRQASPAAGTVTFGRAGDPGIIPAKREACTYSGEVTCRLQNPLAIDVVGIEGISGGRKVAFGKGSDYGFGAGVIAWIAGGMRPDPGSVFFADYTAYESVIIPQDTVVSNNTPDKDSVRTFKTTREASLEKTPGGAWEAEVPVVAVEPGRAGNVFAGSISVMPVAVAGVEYVFNAGDTVGGAEKETDEELRSRARRTLEVSGRGTIQSIRAAVREVPGVRGNVVVIDQPEEVPGIVQVIALGGDPAAIESAIERTRAAGIKAEFRRPKILPLDIRMQVSVVKGANEAGLKAEIDSAVRTYLGSLEIGDPVRISRIIGVALNAGGVKDVKGVRVNGSVENVPVNGDERAEYRTLEITTEPA